MGRGRSQDWHGGKALSGPTIRRGAKERNTWKMNDKRGRSEHV